MFEAILFIAVVGIALFCALVGIMLMVTPERHSREDS